MPKPKTSPDLSPNPYRLLKSDIAAKLSPRSQGGISYVLLADTSDTPDLYIAVTEILSIDPLPSRCRVRDFS